MRPRRGSRRSSAWRSGRARILVASVQALIQHTIAPADLPDEPRRLRPGSRVTQSALLRDLLALGYCAGPRGRRQGRVRAPRRDRGRLPAVGQPPGPDRVLRRRGRIAPRVRSDRPAERRRRSPRSRCCRPPSSSSRTRAPRPWRAGSGSAPSKLPERAGRGPRAAARCRRGAQVRGHEPPRGHETRAAAVGDAAEIWAPILAPSTPLDHVDPGSLLVLDEPGDLAEAAEFLWRQADERRAELDRRPATSRRAWPDTLLGRRAWKSRLLGAADPRAQLGVGDGRPTGRSRAAGSRRATRSAGANRHSRPAGPRSSAMPSSGGAPRVRAKAAERPRASSSRRTRRPGSPSSSRRPATRPASPAPSPSRRRPGAIVLVERSLNGGFAGGPDGLVFVTDRELFGNVRVRRPKAMRRVVPRDILERLTPGDLVVHIDHGVARYERMLRRSAGEGDERDYLEISFAAGDRIFVPVEQIARVTRYSGGERPQLSQARRHGVAADQAARPEGASRTSPRSSSRCTRRAPAPPATRTRRTPPGRPRWRRASRTRRPWTSSAPSSR